MPSDNALDRAIVLDAVQAALADLVAEDAALLELDAHELALVHRFGVYLEERLGRRLRRHQLSIDLDYDRHGYLAKLLPERPDRDGEARFRPDLVIHRRMSDSHNLLVLEWKKHANDQILDLLRVRLSSLIRNVGGHGDYGYDLGVIVNSDDSGASWFAFDCDGPIEDWRRVGPC